MITADTVFLVVDDADTMRKVNSSQLERLGARHILTAANGAEALAVLRARKVNVILSDWSMPVMDGLTLLREVRGNPRLAALPFIMVTAESSRAQITEAIAAGVSSILIKPYTANDLSQRIIRAMRHRPRAPVVAVAEEPAHESEPPAERKPTLLVVDDVPDNLALIAGLFQDDYRVLAARDGHGALAICTSDAPPDLILLDVMMPNMDGFELAQHLRSHPSASQIPVIFITAMSDPAAQLRGLELGAVDFVSKPVDPKSLHLRVVNLLRLVEQRNALQQEYDTMLELERLREEASSLSRHDLKAPLCNILGLARGLLEGGNLLPRQQQMLHSLESDCQSLLGMVDLANDLHKIETGRFVLRPAAVDLLAMVRRLCDSARLTYQAKGLTIEVVTQDASESTPLQASGDELLCFSLLNNLLKNACEAAPDKSRVRVTLAHTDCIELLMENHPAVPPAFRPRFFEKYASDGKAGGTGLGTYSAKLLAEAQHGSLELEVDDAENLTRLRLRLPV
ncbi:hybrid sensor histidine kinase/response regulator [Pseudomonas sp. Gutcm_11s]|uniref:hybrid sensor histidine kinase/response regulator n=1 Tax=Pseudomonas sp. Gutcm_11s TaxID=3026088 RepID=UPI00236157D6|nr:hybrid sensor histidine kinase/response regulator [Pseudomonas sp. Gutcm_11s]MDD0843795.1 hybrid sensor histidine kinase/response regulator [Pseudomonas sp. Gutcm_11s]